MAGCGGMGQRKPDMKGHQTCLRPRSQKHQQSRYAGRYYILRLRPDAGEAVVPVVPASMPKQSSRQAVPKLAMTK